MKNKTGRNKTSRKWDKADKVNGAGVLIALIGLVLGVGLPDVLHGIAYLRRPQASITWPANYDKMKNDTFNAYGTASNIPAGSDLWLMVRPILEVRWYPVQRLRIVNGRWYVPKRLICPASGLQELMIYEIPDSEESQLLTYQGAGNPQVIKGTGLDRVPPDSVVKAAVTVQVPAHKQHVWC